MDTYRPADIEKLGIRNATDLTTFLPQQAGGTKNLNARTGGDGTVQFNLRGLLSKETLVLVDGKRVAFGSLNAVGFSGGVDINLIPFPMIDHIDILKDGASAVYGSDAIAGVVNFYLIHKFRGLEIGGSYGNTNLGASNEMGEWEAWIKAGTGDDKTDIVVIADFWERTGGLFSRDRDLTANAFYIPWGGFESRDFTHRRSRAPLASRHVFRSRRYTAIRREHATSALGAEFVNFAILQDTFSRLLWHSSGNRFHQSQCVSRCTRYHRPACVPVPSPVRH